MRRVRRRWRDHGLAVGPVLLGLVAACSSGQSTDAPAAAIDGNGDIVAEVASYELVADREQRFLVGLFSGAEGMVSFGTAELTFTFLGSGDEPLEEPVAGPSERAAFLPIPGSSTTNEEAARFTSPSEARGVYGVDAVEFDEPGYWEVEVAIDVDAERQVATAAFEVGDTPHVPLPGDPAPRTDNLLPGAPDAPPTAIDSRAQGDGSVPDAELHATTIVDVLDAGRPLMVVISTPVYCVSRFCGPITDTVADLAITHGDRMDFVHLEVWKDYENTTMNEAAADWIWPDRVGDPSEPWVFLVDASGTIVERWDNVATVPDLNNAVDQLLERST